MEDSAFLERIQHYIGRTKIPNATRYDMCASEWAGFCAAVSHIGLLDCIGLAFRYGRAKGYCAAKAGGRHGKVD